MLVLFLSLLSSFIWASTNHIDKYLISKVAKEGDYKGLIVFSSFVSGILVLPFFLIVTRFKIGIDFLALLYILLAVISAFIAIIFYFKALGNNDTALLIAIYQTIPLFIYILGLVFLGEQLTLKQVLGGLIILLSAIFITFDFKNLNFQKNKKIALFLMLGSSILYSLQDIFFRLATLRVDFNIINAWHNIIMVVLGVVLISIKDFRNSFIDIVKSNGKRVFSLNILNEIIYASANIIANYAMTLSPVAIVSILSTGMQPMFAFVIGLLGIILLPKIFDDKEARADKVQKIICMLCSIIGLIIFNL